MSALRNPLQDRIGAVLQHTTVLPVTDDEAGRLVRRAHAELLGGRLPVRLWDGTLLGDPDADFRLVLTRPGALRSLVPLSDLTAGEAYVRGDLDIEGDAVAALHAAHELAQAPRPSVARLLRAGIGVLRIPPSNGAAPLPRAELDGEAHSRTRDAAAVRFHYDVGNDFFRLFLDADLVYSCAYFLDPSEDLETAQRRKLEVICRKLRLRPGARLLDIGCGWGSLAIHAARHHGARVVGVTLSERQVELARERVAAAGLDDVVDIRLQDYRDVQGSFDAIASVGMFEHVGPAMLPTYFSVARRLLVPGGVFLNHGITTGRRMAVSDYTTGRPNFVSAHVFPDGGLVPAWRAVKEMEQVGLEVRDVEQLRPSYALTLREWVRRLEAHHDEAVAAAGEARYRVWRIYMAGSAAAFERGDLGVIQVLGVKEGGEPLPLGRRWMLPDDA